MAACTPKVITRDVPVVVNVPIAQPCATERPTVPTPLKQQTPDWGQMDVRQKAAWVAYQALEWQTYGQLTHAATAACPEIRPK